MANNQSITKRSEDYSQWYQDVIAASGMAEHAPVKGFMVIKPHGYALWENIQRVLDAQFKELGVENAYFPLLIPESFIQKEAEHVEGFAPEMAVVTHAGGKKLAEPLVVRPTSETIINNVFAKWVQSHRDLPLLINQWANVVRWELRPRLFLRSTEFLWQEGHTAHATCEEAEKFARHMLEIYKSFAEEYLAIAIVAGAKSESERFAGAEETYTIEAMMQDGKALQSGTSHFLGQNFAKAFGVKFLDESGKEQLVWQTSWGVSTRLVGAVIMAHGDDKGVVLPPRVAPIQAVIIPIANDGPDAKKVFAAGRELYDILKKEGVAARLDDRDGRPGPKFFEWEKKGVPLRIELGARELGNGEYLVARRDDDTKSIVKKDHIISYVKDTLADIQKNLLTRSRKLLKDRSEDVDSWEGLKKVMERPEGGFAWGGWCESAACEVKANEELGATIRCLPFDVKREAEKCVVCGKKAVATAVFAKAY